MSNRLTSAEPSARLGTAGRSDWMPSFLATPITLGMPTASVSCTAMVLSELANAWRKVTWPRIAPAEVFRLPFADLDGTIDHECSGR